MQKLPYFKSSLNDTDITNLIYNIIEDKKIKFLADFLQFKINAYVDRFPRIKKLRNSEIPNNANDLKDIIKDKLNANYEIVNRKKEEIFDTYLDIWINDYDSLELQYLPSKEIFTTLKGSIFQNPPNNSDIAKDMAILMENDEYMPTQLQNIFVEEI